MRKIAVLTGGGDAPGLNACISAIVKWGYKNFLEVYGFIDGWKGVLDKNVIQLTPPQQTEELLLKGGTILGTSRVNPKDQIKTLVKNLKELQIEILITIGGDDTHSISSELVKEGFPVIGIPKTIDNDLSSTDYCIGFDTAVHEASNLIDKLHTTAQAHNRTFVVEIMGRETGWIAIKSGIASGAHIILIPEFPVDLNEIYKTIRERYQEGSNWAIVVIAEGVNLGKLGEEKDPFGNIRLGGVGEILAEKIQKNVGIETRYINLGHLIRGGTPTAYDRVMAIKLGIKAIDLIKENKFGEMIAIKDGISTTIPFKSALIRKKVPKLLYDIGKRMS